MHLAEAVLSGNRLALARLLTQVENGTPEGVAALDFLFPFTGKAHLIGITGAPGTGKSSLVNQLARAFRHLKNGASERRVAVVAVDPSSPFTGGALLGDRVRMRDLAGDAGVFIRSMASRGALGGLARATASVVQVLDAAGYDVIMVETVGVGQSEVDIARLAYTTLVVEAPGLGDDIQASKAGILEIADILVVNKADQAGADNTERSLRAMLEMAYPSKGYRGHHGVRSGEEAAADMSQMPAWVPPVMRTVALDASGIEELAQAILQHGEYLRATGEWQRREYVRLKNELDDLLRAALMARWQSGVRDDDYRSVLEQLCARQISPYQAVARLLEFGIQAGGANDKL
ncbi:MAG: methylmalonyl Co-A mutase-associated GTPase MeaB [Anaerolineae bacterium]|nr:methylmalonyl Co-A mutase-associated GTPase MeaB [Anaerolineae bacterium]